MNKKLEKLNEAIKNINEEYGLSIEPFSSVDYYKLKNISDDLLEPPYIDQPLFYDKAENIELNEIDVDDDLKSKVYTLSRNAGYFKKYFENTLESRQIDNLRQYFDKPQEELQEVDYSKIIITPVMSKKSENVSMFNRKEEFNKLSLLFSLNDKYDINDIMNVISKDKNLKEKYDKIISELDIQEDNISNFLNMNLEGGHAIKYNEDINNLMTDVFKKLKRNNMKLLPIMDNEGTITFINKSYLENNGIEYNDVYLNSKIELDKENSMLNVTSLDGNIYQFPFKGVLQEDFKNDIDNKVNEIKEDILNEEKNSSSIQKKAINSFNEQFPDNSKTLKKAAIDSFNEFLKNNDNKEIGIFDKFKKELNIYNKVVEDYERSYREYRNETNNIRKDSLERFERKLQNSTLNNPTNLFKNPLLFLFPVTLYSDLAKTLYEGFITVVQTKIDINDKLKPLYEDVSEKREEIYKIRENINDIQQKIDAQISEYQQFISSDNETKKKMFDIIKHNEVYQDIIENNSSNLKLYDQMLTGTYSNDSNSSGYVQVMKSLSQLDKHVINIHKMAGISIDKNGNTSSVIKNSLRKFFDREPIEEISKNNYFKTFFLTNDNKVSMKTAAYKRYVKEENRSKMLNEILQNIIDKNKINNSQEEIFLKDRLHNLLINESLNVNEFYENILKDEVFNKYLSENYIQDKKLLKKEVASILSQYLRITDGLNEMKKNVIIKQSFAMTRFFSQYGNNNKIQELYKHGNTVKNMIYNSSKDKELINNLNYNVEEKVSKNIEYAKEFDNSEELNIGDNR